MPKTLAAIALTAAALASASPTAAQIKAGIPPKPWSVIKAERAAKAEREAAQRMADAAKQGHAEAFAKLDADDNGRLSLDEFKEAKLEDETIVSSGEAPKQGR